MSFLNCRSIQRAIAAIVSVALAASGLAGCASKPSAYARLDGVVVDGHRLAGPGEAGLVTVMRDGRNVDVRAGMELRPGDRIATGPRAEAVIRWASGSELFMRPNSSGRIGSFFDTIGEVFARIRGRFEVETTFVRAGAQGTSYLVRAAPGGETTVIVFEGSVRVDSTRGAWAPVMLGAGQMAIAHPAAPRPMPAGETGLQETRAWVERLERLVPAPTSVSSTEAAVAAGALAVAVAAILASRSRSKDGGSPPATEGSGTGRAGASGTGTTPQEPARPLGTPSGLSPDKSQTQGRPINCTGPVSFSWRPVDGARDYVVRIERQASPSQPWRSASSTATAATRTVVSQKELDSSNRWSVQARDGSRTGPVSTWAYFDCNFVVLR